MQVFLNSDRDFHVSVSNRQALEKHDRCFAHLDFRHISLELETETETIYGIWAGSCSPLSMPLFPDTQCLQSQFPGFPGSAPVMQN